MASHRSGEMQLETYGYHHAGGTGGSVGVRPRLPLTHQGETHVIRDAIQPLILGGNDDRLHNQVPLTDSSAASASAQSPLEPPPRPTPDGTARSSNSARDPDQQRGDSRPTTTIIVNYTEPEGTRYLPIYQCETITMIHIGQHNGHHAYEPINRWFKLPRMD